MQGSPLLTDDAPAGQTAGVEQPAPLITGETPYLATGVVAVIVVMVLILILIGRWRVASRARAAVDNKDFFQPAGAGAEITFDDGETPIEAETFDENDFHPQEDVPEIPKKKSSPFAGLFGKRDRSAEAQGPARDPQDAGQSDSEFAAVSISREPSREFDDEPRQPPPVDWSEIERESRRRAEEEAEKAALERARREEEAAEQARWRSEDEDRRRKLAEDDRRRAERDAAAQAAARDAHHLAADAAVHDDIVKSLSEFEEALHVQREAIQAETRSLLDSFARRFSDRLDALARSVEQRAAQAHEANWGSSPAADPAILGDLSRRLDDHRHEVDSALRAFSERLDAAPADAEALRSELAELKQSINGAVAPSAPSVQLSDIVRNALAPAGYEFNAVLANNRRADCLIRLSRPPGPIAIDARFPVEAFHALHERRSEAAENEFRRTALRHIASVAERLISPGFTADSAMMFLPSESMASELHTRFPDVVQDSYRARVWIVSPTTLMATLHTLSAFLRDASARAPSGSVESVARRALSEIDRLSARIAALEHEAPAPRRQEPQDLLSANDAAEWRPSQTPTGDFVDQSPPSVPDRGGERYCEDHHAGDARHQTQARPPFPLR